MISDSERREVAARLREIRPCKSGHIEWWTIAKALDLKESAGWFGWEKFEPDSANRLADLIEPSCDRDIPQKVAEEMFGKMRHSTKEEADAYDAMLKSMSVELHPVDRDALLELANEMEQEPGPVCGVCMGLSANRIRKALGVIE